MDAGDNERPIIIKKIKKGGGDGHHGGAWKVAYADFVTAMMAFFLLMWLLNATTEKQRKGVADYFTPTIAIAKVSGGGDGSFGGDSVFTEQTLARNGTGASMEHPTSSDKASGNDGEEGIEEVKQAVDELLMGQGGESMLSENELKHINTRITDEGLVLEFFETEDSLLYERGTANPTRMLRTLAMAVNEIGKAVTNGIAVETHMAAQPIVVANASTWQLSTDRAIAMREILQSVGLPPERHLRVTGHADRQLHQGDPLSVRNNRVEVIFVRNIPK